MPMRIPVPSRRLLIIMAWVVGALFLFTVSYLLIQVLHLGSTVGDLRTAGDASDRKIATQQATNTKQDRALAEANRRLIKAGKPPVAAPPVTPPQNVLLPGLPGATGARGAVGATGAVGPIGPKGAIGASGAKGAIGASGANGPAGPTGAPGANGTNGVDGKNGADGATGAAGADGRGVTSVDCTGPPQSFTFTFSDGTTQTVTCTAAP